MAALLGSAIQLASPAAQALSIARAVRSAAPTGGNKGEHLGKNLSHHQVVPADQQPRTANNPRTDFGKAVLSGTGGNPRAVNQAIDGIRSVATSQISPFHRRRRFADNFGTALKHTPHAKNFNSN